MIDMEAIHQHFVLGGDHVVIVVLREVHAQAVGRLTRLAVPDIVRQDDIELGDIEWLAGSEEHIGKHWVEQGMSAAPSTMQKENGVIGMPGRVSMWLTQSEVVEL
jgi:hypothetical protein